ncbi:hypothetical protein [Streptomyces sp. G-G2]|uniref:hypothetical protein n=1 Tax=Streptomyces sp. G-G2 TaxID=3046201 RepID=UPI0024B9422E|nr:hypothetical protein [Streptomyces sp. G-G2]MDJ0382676.1 hypothetical protein [Streptomyces sp. G-G2]
MTDPAPTQAPGAGLGFNPAPGSPAAVRALTAKLRSSAGALGEASSVIDALVSRSTSWHGEAATAFRDSLSDDLPRYLRSAHTSLEEAARRLTSWHDTLVAHQALAARYASRAAAATTPEALSDARRLAHELAAEHTAAARRIARTLDAASDRLAPKEPGFLESVWQKMTDDPADALSNMSAVLGLASLCVAAFCPPVGVALALVAGGLSLAALTMHASDPKFRKSLSDGFTKGDLDADFWKSGVTLLGDALGAVPGVAAVASGAKAGVSAARVAAAVPEATALSGLSAGASTLSRTAWRTAGTLQDIDNPITSWALRSTSPAVQRSVSAAFPVTGAATAVLDYVPGTSDTTQHTATAVDGVRGVVDDAPSAAAKTAHVLSAVNP